jgi:DNA-binding NtrC family response regulator
VVNEELRILIIEDSEDDSELLLWELRRGDFEPVWERVETEQGMIAALERQPWDLVIADYVMPRFTGLAALHLLQKRGIDLPFIVVSGKVGEETAVEAMKAGAHDYFLKGQLARLVPAIRRELTEARVRHEQKRVAAELKLLKQAVETIPIGLTITDLERRILYTNPAEARMHGYMVDELLGEDVRVLAPHDTWRSSSAAELKAMQSLSRESYNIRKW